MTNKHTMHQSCTSEAAKLFCDMRLEHYWLISLDQDCIKLSDLNPHHYIHLTSISICKFSKADGFIKLNCLSQVIESNAAVWFLYGFC